MKQVDVLKRLNLSKYHINRYKKAKNKKKEYKKNLKMARKYYKNRKQIGGTKRVNEEFDLLLKMIEDLLDNKNTEIQDIQANITLSNKKVKDVEAKYEFLVALKSLTDNMIKLFVKVKPFQSLVEILEDQLDTINSIMRNKPTKKFNHDEKEMIKSILNNNERIHPNILSKIVNANRAKLDNFNDYLEIMINLLYKNNSPSSWNYKTDAPIIAKKAEEMENKLQEFDNAVDMKYLIKNVEENMNIFDGCYCSSKCTFQDKPDTAHWCYTTKWPKCKRGNQSSAFIQYVKTCNPYKDNNGKITSVDRDFYNIGKHPMVSQTNRKVICTKKENNITKFAKDYNCNPKDMITIAGFVRQLKKEYRNNYKNALGDYYKNLKKNMLEEIEKSDSKEMGTQTDKPTILRRSLRGKQRIEYKDGKNQGKPKPKQEISIQTEKPKTKLEVSKATEISIDKPKPPTKPEPIKTNKLKKVADALSPITTMKKLTASEKSIYEIMQIELANFEAKNQLSYKVVYWPMRRFKAHMKKNMRNWNDVDKRLLDFFIRREISPYYKSNRHLKVRGEEQFISKGIAPKLAPWKGGKRKRNKKKKIN